MNDEGVYRTAPATPDLLTIVDMYFRVCPQLYCAISKYSFSLLLGKVGHLWYAIWGKLINDYKLPTLFYAK